jgi:uncharacterized protein DUF6879
MKVCLVRSECKDEPCPALYETDRRSALVQGYVVDDPEALSVLNLPDGETVVEVPWELLVGLAKPGEELRMFLLGEPKPQQDETPWQEMLRNNAEQARLVHRVHLIRGGLTDYVRWEIGWGYPDDDELAVLMRYGPEGEWLGRDATRDPEILELCREKRDRALVLAVPFSEYLPGVET